MRNTITAEREQVSVGATPETSAKLQPDPLTQLYNDRMIDSAGLRAAEQIGEIVRIIGRDVMLKSPTLGIKDVGRYEMPDKLARAFSLVYVPWRTSLDPVVANFVVKVVVDRPQLSAFLDRAAVAMALMVYAERMER